MEDHPWRRHQTRRRQAVDGDAVGVHLGGQTRGKTLDRRFAHAVHGRPRPRRKRRSFGMDRRARRDVQDPSAATLSHAGKHPLGQLERGTHLDLEHHLEVALGEIEHWLKVGDSGVVDQHLDRPELALDRLDQPRAIRLFGQVGHDRENAPAAAANLLGGGRQAAAQAVVALLGSARRDGHSGATRGETVRDRCADASARASDESYAVHGCGPPPVELSRVRVERPARAVSTPQLSKALARQSTKELHKHMEHTHRNRNLWIGLGVVALLVLVALPMLGGGMMGRGFADGAGYGVRPGFGAPWMWGFFGIGLIVKLLFWGLIAFFLVNVFRRRARWHREIDDRDYDYAELSSVEILRRRYAAGEITREQYEEMRRVLEPRPSA